jgi:hypothetical protein
VLAEWLLTRKTLRPKVAGPASLSSHDLFTRPSGIVGALSEDVVVPAVGKYRSTALAIVPVRPASGERPSRRPVKSGEFDDTVIAGGPGLQLTFVPEILRHLKKITPAGSPLFGPSDLSKYGSLLQEAVTACGLAKLHITPHSARHGGASSASYRKLLKIKEIQRRGRWLVPKSVRRYETSGKLTRQVALMDKATVR